jgi:hypothetical protein
MTGSTNASEMSVNNVFFICFCFLGPSHWPPDLQKQERRERETLTFPAQALS